MVDSVCLKCGGKNFEAGDISPNNISAVLLAVRCSSCGSVIGIVDDENIAESVENMLLKHADEMKNVIDDLKNRLVPLSRLLDTAIETLQESKK